MNLALITTDVLKRASESMRPYHNVLGLTGPNEISSNIKFAKTITSTMSNWINHEACWENNS